MKLRLLLLGLVGFFASIASAHVGSPDVFFDGMVGPWQTHITIRMPGVVPGRAEIIAQIQTAEPVTVTFTPLASRVSVTNAPPPETAQLVRGATNLYSGDLWLMTFGAYSIQVNIRGPSGQGSVLIPVNSVATSQLPLPPILGKSLAVLAVLLFCAGMVIVAAAAGESTTAPGLEQTPAARRKYWIALTVTGVVLISAAYGGKKWWAAEEADFRTRLREGGWPDLTSDVRLEGAQRILRLDLGKSTFRPGEDLGLTLDHGKLLHLFVVSLPDHRSIAHLHPVRRDDKTFEVPLPPFPEGDYELFCDCTFQSGLSSTATNVVHLPAIPAPSPRSSTNYLDPDPDDSWIVDAAAVPDKASADTAFRLANGDQIVWKAHGPSLAKQNAGFQFQVLDASGHPVDLQPYMGMMSHAAVIRSDGHVFAHLHPTGNFSMAAQMLFDAKMTRETGQNPSMTMITPTPASTISIPYEFPTPGDYRVIVQIKSHDQIQTAVFDANVN